MPGQLKIWSQNKITHLCTSVEFITNIALDEIFQK